MKYTEITKVRIEPFSFIEDCFNHNSQISDFEDRYFLEYTAGLLNFGNMILNLKNYNHLTLYQIEKYIPGIGYKMIYYAIDNTGVCHGHIYGPSTKFIETLNHPSENLYFGLGKTEEYFLIENWKNNSNTISARNVYSYLPLKFSKENQFKLYSTPNKEIIYQKNNEAFLIPFEEIIKQELNIRSIQNLNISNKLDHFEFKYTITSHEFRKENNTTLYSGKIDKKNFDVEIIKEETD